MGSVLGVVIDSSTSLPIIRGLVCQRHEVATGPYNCSRTDTLGRFRLARLPLGEVTLTVECGSTRLLRPGMETVVVSANVAAAGTDVGIVRVPGFGCDQRPRTRRSGEFVGYYTYGWEEGRFRWTADTMLGIWVGGPMWAAAGAKLNWPAPTRDNPWPCAFVRWYGTLIGPDFYGHLGVSSYQLTVDSIAEAREAPKAACVP